MISKRASAKKIWHTNLDQQNKELLPKFQLIILT